MRRLIAFAVAALPAVALAKIYDVGPNQPYANIGDVPWASLAAGDAVQIHARPTPYKAKWVINAAGTANQPIVVRGIPDGTGALPKIVGDGATTPAGLDFWNEDRGLIKIGGSNVPPDGTPSYIVLEGLDLASARTPYTFTGKSGPGNYADNAASVYIEKGQHITLRNLNLHDSGNGLFIANQTSDVLVESCHLFDNGIEGSDQQHNNYTEANGIVFQYNWFGALRANCDGNNLKDRSTGTVIRYNWIEYGNRALDLVDSDVLNTDSKYLKTFVYGNVFIKGDGGNNQLIHYGGDSGNTAVYRNGTLYLYDNTLVSTRNGNTTLLRLSTAMQHADARNNVLYVTGDGGGLGMLDGDGSLDLLNNFLKPGWVQSHGMVTGVVSDGGGEIIAMDPGFLDEAGQDYRLKSTSPCVGAAAPLHPDAHLDYTVDEEYVPRQTYRPRTDAMKDVGAYGHFVPPPPDGGVVTPDLASAGADGGAQDMQPGGCGCTVGAAPVPVPVPVLALLAVAFLIRGSARKDRA